VPPASRPCPAARGTSNSGAFYTPAQPASTAMVALDWNGVRAVHQVIEAR
jgi:hypothetical protein